MNKRKKVFLLHNLVTPYRLPLFEELSKKVDLTVYFCENTNSTRKWSTNLERYSFNYKILPNKKFGPFIINKTLGKELRKNRYDAYIAFENPENALSILTVLNSAKKNNRPLILVNGRKDDEIYSLNEFKETSNLFKKSFYYLSKSIYSKYRKFVYNRTTNFISYCQATTDYLISRQINSSHIYTGIEIYPQSLLTKPSSKINKKEYPNKKIILHLGYLSKRKGVDYLIKAFDNLNRQDAVLLIAGDGEERHNLEKLAKGKNIYFLGYKEGIEKANLFSIADFFVLPTLYDVWGFVINESLYYGCPVITTKAASASELIEENYTGLVINSKSVLELQKAMQHLLDNTQLLKKIKHNLKNYPLDKIVNIRKSVSVFENAIQSALNQHVSKNNS